MDDRRVGTRAPDTAGQVAGPSGGDVVNGPLESSASDPQGLDPATEAVLRLLLTLPPATARRIRDATPRRRARRSQDGPGVDLGSGGKPPD